MDNAKGRLSIDFNDGWRFKRLTRESGLDRLDILGPDFDFSCWETISLPHTWNDQDGCSGPDGIKEGGEHYYRGAGGYEKSFFLPPGLMGKRIFLELGGANTVAWVFVNGSPAGVHEGGYSMFRLDITSLLRFDGINRIIIRVSNAPTDYIPPITNQGDFTKMGGIYRKVRLIAVEPVHIELLDLGGPGAYITPCNISKRSADIRLAIGIRNDGEADCRTAVCVEIFGREGGKTPLLSKKVYSELHGHGCEKVELTLRLADPIFWDGVKNPYLYTARVSLSDCGGTPLDAISESFGVRSFYVDPEKGFFLNGVRTDLHGVNYHQDSFESGWAMTDSQRERDYGIMRELGCTTVRLAHYQHDSYEYTLCDRLGLAVWTEIGIVNTVSPDNDTLAVSEAFVKNAEQQLKELIRQCYNHPSVFFIGISNELYQMSDEIFGIYSRLCELARAEDPTRLIVCADNQAYGDFNRLPTDLVGYNKYFGWYIDSGEDALGVWLDKRRSAQSRAVAISEYGGGGAISQHMDNIVWERDIDPWGKRHYECYQASMHENILKQLNSREYLWGKYVWCLFDFASDGRVEGDTVGQNDKGLATRERVPKDAFYLYQSVWSDKPMLRLTQKRFSVRKTPVPIVKAYSNLDEVKLFVDGAFVGVGKRDNTVFTWENVSIKTGAPSKIRVSAMTRDGILLEDAALWEAEE